MGKFFKYEDSNFRTFKIDTTAATIQRPKRPITGADMIGAIIGVDGEQCLVVGSKDGDETITASIVVDANVIVLTYTKATDAFAFGEIALTNVMIDEFGREHVTLD